MEGLPGFKELLAFLNPNKQAENLNDAARRLLKNIGEHGASRLKERIASGQVGGPALQPITQTHKRQRGLDARKLIATGAYMRSFQYKFETPRRIRIGAARRYEKLSNWLEFGTSQMAARPHIRPAFHELLRYAEKAAKKEGFDVRGFGG